MFSVVTRILNLSSDSLTSSNSNWSSRGDLKMPAWLNSASLAIETSRVFRLSPLSPSTSIDACNSLSRKELTTKSPIVNAWAAEEVANNNTNKIFLNNLLERFTKLNSFNSDTNILSSLYRSNNEVWSSIILI